MQTYDHIQAAIVEIEELFASLARLTLASDLEAVGIINDMPGPLAFAYGHLKAAKHASVAEAWADIAERDLQRRIDRRAAELPDPVPQPGKRLKSRDVKCPTCKAKPGAGCFRMSRRGVGAVPTTEPLGNTFHKSRTKAAREAS